VEICYVGDGKGSAKSRVFVSVNDARKVEAREDESPKEQFKTIWLYDIILKALYHVHGKQWRVGSQIEIPFPPNLFPVNSKLDQA